MTERGSAVEEIRARLVGITTGTRAAPCRCSAPNPEALVRLGLAPAWSSGVGQTIFAITASGRRALTVQHPAS